MGNARESKHPGVLVTGSHRSGSTWVGRLLGAADELHYVQEPFNIVAHQRWLVPRPPQQFFFVDESNEAAWVEPMRRVVDLRYPLLSHLRHRFDRRTVRRMGRVALDAARARRAGAAPLIKDPIALFSAPWLRRRFGLQVVVLVREPVSFVGSLKDRQWDFDFRHWTEQPALMSSYLSDHRDEIAAMVDRPDADIVEQGIVQWNSFYGAVDRMRSDDPSLIVIDYETIAANPRAEVESLYGQLGIAFGPGQRDTVAALSSGSGGSGASAIDVHRDSRAALATWRDRLTDDEIDRIRQGTREVSARFGIDG